MGFFCYKCNNTIEHHDNISRQDSCSNCNFDLKVCLNCTHYDVLKNKECHESATLSEAVKDKEKANFCDYFKFKSTHKKAHLTNPSDELLSAAEALFKK